MKKKKATNKMRKFLNLIRNIKFLIQNWEIPGVLIITCKITNKRRKMFLIVKSLRTQAITFPSGSLHPLEGFYEAAARELLEETGLKIKKSELVLTPLIHKFKYSYLPIQIKSQQKVFFALLKKKHNITVPQDKNVAWARWYNFDKTLSLLTYQELKVTFKKAAEFLKKYERDNREY